MNTIYKDEIKAPTKATVGTKIKEKRQERYSEYLDHIDEPNNPFNKYAFCKDQGTFAKELKVSRKTVVCWENGTNFPKIDVLVKISDALDANLEYFVGFFDCSFRNPIAICSHFTNIRPEIIEKASSDDNYSFFLNFFMNPDNCQHLIDETTLSGWKGFVSNTQMEQIGEPLRTIVHNAYNMYDAFVLYDAQSKERFKSILTQELAKNRITPSIIKKSLPLDISLQFINNGKVDNLEKLADYLAETSYSALRNYATLDRNKENLGKQFAELYIKYIATLLSEE